MAPGLTKLNVQKTTAKSTTAAQLASTTKRASSSGKDYGIFAQRSTTGLGIQYNAKLYHSASIDSQIREINRNREPFILKNIDDSCNCSSGNKYDKTMGIAMGVAGGLAMAGVLAKGIMEGIQSLKEASPASSSSTTSESTSTTSSQATVQDGNGASLAGMENAKDYTSLNAAITKAEADQAGITQKLSSADSALNTLKGQTDKLKLTADDAQADYDQNLSDIKSTTEALNSAKQELTSCQAAYDAVANLPEKDAQGNTISGVKEKKDAAKEKLEAAKEKVKEQNDKLSELKAQTDDLKQKAGDAKDAYDNNLKEIETKQKEIKQLESDQKEYKKEIPKQKKRLEELKKKEEKELTNVNTQVTNLQKEITKLSSKINVKDEDGYSKKDKKTKQKVDEKSSELEKLKQKQAELRRKDAIRKLTPETVINGIEFKTGAMPDGSTVYLVGGKEVIQNEYLNAKRNNTSKTS